MMKQFSHVLELETPGAGLHEITVPVREWAEGQSVDTGLLNLFCRHTSCSLLVQENAAPAARRDLEAYFQRIAPEHPTLYAHDDEGPDDMPAHLRAALTSVSLAIPLVAGELSLGRWQRVYLFEHRRQPHRRRLALHLIGE